MPAPVQGRSNANGALDLDGIKPNANWQQHSDNARAAVLGGVDGGQSLLRSGSNRVTAQSVHDALDSPKFSVKSTQAALDRLRQSMKQNGLDPANITGDQLRAFFGKLPKSIFAVPVAGAVGSQADFDPAAVARAILASQNGL